MPKQLRGFSLIELMIVIAILGIVVAFGYPSYRDQVMKARRAEGLGELLELAGKLERHYADQVPGTYAGATLGSNPATNIHRAYTENSHYLLNIDSADTVTFTVRATPQGKQANDKCGVFILDSLGTRSLSGNSVAFDKCWR